MCIRDRINEVYAKHFKEPYPARSCVQVARLPKDVAIEIEAVAVKDVYKRQVYALAAAVQAFDDSGLDMEKEDAAKVGVIVGSGIGGLMTMQEQVIRLHEKGPSRVSPLFIPMTISNMAAGNIAVSYTHLCCMGAL